MVLSTKLKAIIFTLSLSSCLLHSTPKNHFSEKEIAIELSSVAGFTEIKDSLAHLFSKHRITGCAFALDPNIAFIIDGQNPSYVLKYKDDNGHIRSRLYTCQINSIGLKVECAYRLNLMFITDRDFTFENSNKIIFLSQGLEVHMPYLLGGVSVSYVSFINAPGGMFTLSMSFGPSMSIASYIYGGYIKPVC